MDRQLDGPQNYLIKIEYYVYYIVPITFFLTYYK